MSRKKSREVAMELVYQQSIVKEPAEVIYADFVELNEEKAKKLELKYINDILYTIEKNAETIEEKISSSLSSNWRIERLPKINLAILKLAVCEMLYMDDIPNKVSINEAIEIAKKYSDYKSVSFVNGVLDKISKTI